MDGLEERLKESEEARARAVAVVVKQSEEFRVAENAMRAAEAAYAVTLERERMSARMLERELEATKRSLRDVTNRLSERPVAENRIEQAFQEEQRRRLELEIENKAIKKRLADFHRSVAAQESKEVEFELERQKMQVVVVEKENIIKSLREKVQGLDSTNRDARSRAEELMTSLEAREQELKDAHRTTAEVVSELEQHMNASSQLQEELAREEERVSRLQSDRAQLREMLGKRDAELRSSSEFIRALSKRVSESRRINFELHSQLVVTRESNKTLNERIAKLEIDAVKSNQEALLARQQSDDATQLLIASESSLEKTELKLRQAQQRLEVAEEVVSNKSNTLRDSGGNPIENQQEMACMRGKLLASEKDVALLLSEYKGVEKALMERTAKLLSAERRVRVLEQSLHDAESRVAHVHLDVEQAKIQIRTYEEAPHARELEIDELKKEIDELQNRFVDHDSLTRSKNAEVGKLKEKLLVTEENLQQKAKELRSTTHSLDEAFRQIEFHRQLVTDKDAALSIRETELSRLREAAAKNEETISDLRSIIGSSNKQTSEIQQSFGELSLRFKEKQDELSASEYEKSNLQSSVEEASERVKLLERTVKSSQDEVHRVNLELQRLLSDRDRQGIELISSKRALESNEKLMDQMRQELAEARLDVERQQSEVRIMRENATHQMTSLSALQSRLHELEMLRALLTPSAPEETEDQGDGQRAEVEHLRERVDTFEEKAIRLQDEIALQRRAFQAQVDEINALKAICSTSDKERQAYIDEVESLKESLALKHSEVEQNALVARSTVEEERGRVRSLEIILQEKQGLISKLSEDLDSKNRQMAALAQRCSETDAKCASIKARVDSLSGKLELETKKAAALEDELRIKMAQLESEERKRESGEEKIRQLEESANQNSSTIQNLQQLFLKREDDLRQLNQALASLQGEYQTAVNDGERKDGEVFRLTSELHRLEEVVRRSQSELSQKADEIVSLDRMEEELRLLLNSEKEINAIRSRTIEENEKQMNELKGRLQESHRDLVIVREKLSTKLELIDIVEKRDAQFKEVTDALTEAESQLQRNLAVISSLEMELSSMGPSRLASRTSLPEYHKDGGELNRAYLRIETLEARLEEVEETASSSTLIQPERSFSWGDEEMLDPMVKERLNNYERTIAQLQKWGEFMKSRLIAEETRVTVREQRIVDLETSLVLAKDSFSFLNETLEAAEKESAVRIEDLTTKIGSLESTITELQVDLASRIDEVSTERHQRMRDLQQFDEKLSLAERDRESLETLLHERDTSISDLSSRLGVLRDELGSAHAAISKLRDEQTTESDISQGRLERIGVLERTLRDLEDSTTTTIKSLRAEVGLLLADIQKLERDLDALTRSRDDLQRRVEIAEPLASETKAANAMTEAVHVRMDIIEQEAASRVADMELQSRRANARSEFLTNENKRLEENDKEIRHRLQKIAAAQLPSKNDQKDDSEDEVQIVSVAFFVWPDETFDSDRELVVVGNDSALGSWDVSKGCRMRLETNESTPFWVAETLLPAEMIQYKLAWTSEDNSTYVWEGGDNRAVDLGARIRCDIQVRDGWRGA